MVIQRGFIAGAVLVLGLASGLIVNAQTVSSAKDDARVVVAQSKQKASEAEAAAKVAADESGRLRSAERDRQAKFLTQAADDAGRIMKKGLQDKEKAEAFYAQQKRVDDELAKRREWLQQEQARAARIGNTTVEDLAKRDGAEPERKRPSIVILVSQSMGIDGLKQAIDYGRGRTDVAYAFRGFKPGQDPKSFHQMIVKLVGKDESRIANVMLDPPIFTANNVTTVPTIVYLDKDEKAVAQARGVVNPEWIKTRVERKERGDLGKFGTTYQIAEVDLIEVMKARAANIDLEKEKKVAAQNYFNTMSVLDLPYARATRKRDILAQMQVKEDVVDGNGVVRHRKGEIISMVEELKSAPVLVVFNSQDAYHVAFAKEIVRRYPDKNVILMTTNVDRQGGFARYIKQEQAIGRAVFLLTAEVKSTFRIEKIPTLVRPMKDRFAVIEVPLTQGVQ